MCICDSAATNHVLFVKEASRINPTTNSGYPRHTPVAIGMASTMGVNKLQSQVAIGFQELSGLLSLKW